MVIVIRVVMLIGKGIGVVLVLVRCNSNGRSVAARVRVHAARSPREITKFGPADRAFSRSEKE